MKRISYIQNPRCLGWAVCALAPVLVLSSTARAQWTATSLHDPRFTQTSLTATDGVQFAGNALDTLAHGVIWPSAAPLALPVDEAGFSNSQVSAIGPFFFGGLLIDSATFQNKAIVWFSAAPGAYVDMHPAAAADSAIWGVWMKRCAGEVDRHAALWEDPYEAHADLHPGAPYVSSALTKTNAVSQVGFANVPAFPRPWARAAIWSGSAASFVDLHPDGLGWEQSFANALSGSTQVGAVRTGVLFHAAIWKGTMASFADVNGSHEASLLADVDGNFAAGYFQAGGLLRAGVYNLCDGAWQDLHAALPAGYSQSRARAIVVRGGTIYVVGQAKDSATGNLRAMLWTCPVPTLDVGIDIKPGDAGNTISLRGNGVVVVAVLGSPAFDVSTVDTSSVSFEGAVPIGFSYTDVDLDGDLDVNFRFRIRETSLTSSSTQGCLHGMNLCGEAFSACDAVRVTGG